MEATKKNSEFTFISILLFAVACISACLCGVNVSSVSAVITQVQNDLGVDTVSVSWIMSIYSLITYPSMIMIGRIGDLIGHKKAVILSCAAFALGSIGVILTNNFVLILIFRCIQAIGGGGLPTSCMSLVGVLFRNNRQKMMGIAVNVFPLAQIIGAPVGAWLFTAFGNWRGVFYVNIILMVIAIIVFAIWMPKRPKDENASIREIDFLGAALLCAAVFCLMYAITLLKDVGKGMSKGAVSSVTVIEMIAFFVGFIVIAILFVVRVKKAEHPIIDRQVLFNKKFSSVTFFFFAYGFVALGMAQLIPTFATVVYGFDSTWSSYVVMAKGIGWFVVGLIVASLIKKLGYRVPLIACIIIIAGSYSVIAIMSRTGMAVPATTAEYIQFYWWLFAIAIVLGFGSGAAAPTMTNVAIDLMPENIGTIYGVTAAFRQIGSTLCVPIVTVIVSLFGDRAATGYMVVYFIMAAMILICLPFIFMMPSKPADPTKVRKGAH